MESPRRTARLKPLAPSGSFVPPSTMCHPAQGHKNDLQACRARFVRILDEADAGKETEKDALLLVDAAVDMVMKKLDSSASKDEQLRNVTRTRSIAAAKDRDTPSRLLLGLHPAASPLVSAEGHQRVQSRPTGSGGDRKRQSPTGDDDSRGSPNKRRPAQDCWDSAAAPEHNQIRRLYSHHEGGSSRPQIGTRDPGNPVAPMARSSSIPDLQSLPELPGVETLLRVEQEGNRKKRGSTQLPKLSTLCLPVNPSAMAGPSPPIFTANRSGSREQQHQAPSATLPPLKLAAEGHQYHHHQLPPVLSPEPQDPTVYHHHKLPDPVLSSQDADSRQSSTDQPPFCRTQGLNVCFETPGSSHIVPRRMTASSFQLSPLVQPRRESRSADSLSQEDEVMLDDGTRFKVIRDSKEYTTFEKL